MRAPKLEAVLEHAFIASHPRDGEDLLDEWPVELQRKVSVYLPEIQLTVELCARGQLLAVRRDPPCTVTRVEALIGAMRSQFSNTPGSGALNLAPLSARARFLGRRSAVLTR